MLLSQILQKATDYGYKTIQYTSVVSYRPYFVGIERLRYLLLMSENVSTLDNYSWKMDGYNAMYGLNPKIKFKFLLEEPAICIHMYRYYSGKKWMFE